jgi:hypothetical protein
MVLVPGSDEYEGGRFRVQGVLPTCYVLPVDIAPLCVLSVGRSGTSLTTRALHHLGAHVGAPADLMPASADNRHGYWEHVGIYEINEAILAAFGGSWYDPPALFHGWETDPRLDALAARATALAAELGSTGCRWAFKDPRVAVTLPFWQRVLGELEYVICVRDPQAVIHSIRNTGLAGTTPAASARLWLDMNAGILRQTVTGQRTFVFYEDWFEAPERVAADLARAVHRGAVDRRAGSSMSVDAVLDRSLRRADGPGALVEADVVPVPELRSMLAHLRTVAVHDTPDRSSREWAATFAEQLAGRYRARYAAGRRDGQHEVSASVAHSADLDRVGRF